MLTFAYVRLRNSLRCKLMSQYEQHKQRLFHFYLGLTISILLGSILVLFCWLYPSPLVGEGIFVRCLIDVIPIFTYLRVTRPDEDCFHCYTFNKEKENATLSIFQHVDKVRVDAVPEEKDNFEYISNADVIRELDLFNTKESEESFLHKGSFRQR